MIHLVYANRTEELLAALSRDLRARRAAGAHPLDPVELVVPNRNMEAYVRFGLAQTLGVAANLGFRRLERYLGDLLAEAGGRHRILDREALHRFVLNVLLDEAALDRPELAAVRRYLQGGDPAGVDLRRVQLADRMARLFEEYGWSRADLLEAWGRDPAPPRGEHADLEAWQRALWLRVTGPGGLAERHPPRDDGRWLTVGAFLSEVAALAPPPARPVHVFGVSYMARLFQQALAWMGRGTDVHVYTLNPCMEFWEDVETDAELRRRIHQRRRDGRLGDQALREALDDPYGLAAAENPPLRLWGRPGRENVRLLNELTDCDFEGRFVDPVEAGGTASLLGRLQRDILRREPQRLRPDAREAAGDGSLVFLEAPGVSREAEAVADAIWRLVEAPPAPGEAPLRFSDVAVIVNAADRDLYLPHLEAAFDERHRIPRSVIDLPLSAGSPLAEAADLLLELPFGGLTRPEMLEVMTHPAVLGRWGDVSADDWVHLAEDLGIYFGADRAELAGTYVDQDVFTWDQGVRRLVLGTFMTGARSGDDRLFELDGQAYLPEEIPPGRQAAAARFAHTARGLLQDVREVRAGLRSLTGWAALFRAQLERWPYPSGPDDARDRLECLRAVSSLEALDLDGRPVSGRLASALARRALAALSASRGTYLAEGVVVSSFLPMRAIPFRAVFVLGLGEGRFPAPARRDPLDLRAVQRRPGDVTPAERDRYTFLETLLSTREHLCLSWVGRDEQTGDRIEPSMVLQELRELLVTGYVGQEGFARLHTRVPLRRHEEAEAGYSRMARLEARARALGDSLRVHAGRGDAAEAPRALRGLVPPDAWSRLGALLELPAVPDAATGAAPEVLQLSLSQLRRFLECPVQGAAAAVLNLHEDEDDGLAHRDEEPFELDRRVRTVVLRDALVEAARQGVPVQDAWRERARRLTLAGRMAPGVLGRVQDRAYTALLEHCVDRLDEALGPGARARRLAFGRAREHEPVDEVLPALHLELPGTAGGPARRVELSGRTEALFGEPPVSVMFKVRDPAKAEADLLMTLFLRGLLDHVALSAAGRTPAGGRRIMALLANGNGASLHARRLKPLSQHDARALLTTWVSDLLAGPHDRPLPCEAVFTAWTQAKQGEPSGADLVAQVHALADSERSRMSSRYGPVPRAANLPPPAPDDAQAIYRRRFAPLLGLIEEDR